MTVSTLTTLEWFGATTFRLCVHGLVIFLDTWLEKPGMKNQHLSIDSVTEADYIFISHAHFDHLPGADRLAKRTGAVVIANCEAINLLRNAGVPDLQLMPVQGGERIPLYSKHTLEQATVGSISLRPAPPGAPALPHPDHALMSVDIWPSLHCLLPSHEEIPEYMDTAQVYTGAAHSYVCTYDVNFGMKHGLLRLEELVPQEHRDQGMNDFITYIRDRQHHVFSDHDGGQLMYNIHLTKERTLLWNAHLGGYEGILRTLHPKPSILVQGIAGRANHNGAPYDGSAAQYAEELVTWLEQPERVIWCLHDESCIRPYYVDVTAATKRIEDQTSSRVTDMKQAEVIHLDV